MIAFTSATEPVQIIASCQAITVARQLDVTSLLSLHLLHYSNLPALSVMVKDTREESLFSSKLTVAETTGRFARLSKAIPLTVLFF